MSRYRYNYLFVLTMSRREAMVGYKRAVTPRNGRWFPNARGSFLPETAQSLYALHEEYGAVGKSADAWNVGIWVVIRGVRPGVYYGKIDAVRALGPLTGHPVAVLASDEQDANAIVAASIFASSS